MTTIGNLSQFFSHEVPMWRDTAATTVETVKAIAQIYGRRIEQSARMLFPYMDFSAADAFSKTVLSAGKSVFDRALDGLKEAGVDIKACSKAAES